MNKVVFDDVRTRLISLCGALAVTVLTGCASSGAAPGASSSANVRSSDKAAEGYEPVDELLIVDCLLPGQIRKLGNTVYKTQRRPIRTTAGDCEIRGGEYVAYDRADYRSALKVWLTAAEAGDAEAQNYVGEIFEKGLGRQADYVSAAAWYQRSAEQGYSRAQINLGFLYESGLGVEKNVQKALNLYRQASGVAQSGDDLVWKSEMEAVREELEAELSQARTQVDVLQSQVARLESDQQRLQQQAVAARQQGAQDAAARYEAELASVRQQMATMRQIQTRAKVEEDRIAADLSGMPKLRTPGEAQPVQPSSDRPPLVLRNLNFGRYFALIIGNQDYLFLQDLDSPGNDTREVADVLKRRYGFQTYVVPNGNARDILTAFNDLYNEVGPEDNLLVYYAGHGNLSSQGSGDRLRGYWLPVEAKADSLTSWINNSVVSDHLDRLKARSVLVLADSCYAGTMASQQSALLLGSARAKLSPEAIQSGLSRRSRMVISSGGVKPVIDSADATNSLFAKSLLEVLRGNNEVMRENMLFARVAVGVRKQAARLSIEQNPEMRPIRAAGHEGGDFFLVPENAKVRWNGEEPKSRLAGYWQSDALFGALN
ncbi:MAG: peptidase C14 [Salinisphaeraceae bacterium]|jgi:hypothetical protein|nr:peptidase C14 [Salinisphaeraceae bacterium]